MELDKNESIGREEVYCDWWKCKKCGSPDIHSDCNYCPNCGEKIEWIDNLNN